MQEKPVLFILISEFADWEPALLAAGLRWGYGLWSSPYPVKMVGLTGEPVRSIGGLTVIPDYSLDTAPEDFAALILVGGTSWHESEADKVLPLLHKAFNQNVLVGAICDASIFLAKHGFLNTVPHTFIDPSVMVGQAKGAYSGENFFQDKQSVRGGNIITAKPTGYVEFARDVLSALDVAKQDQLNDFYQLCKTGDCSILMNTQQK